MALPPAPSVSSPSWFMIWVSMGSLWSVFSRALRAVSWSWIFRAGQLTHVLGTHTLTLMRRVSPASEPIPENGLPGCQRNTKLLKYLSIRSLRRLPCNYTCSFHILPQYGHTCARMNMDRFAMCAGVYRSRYVFTHSVLSHTIWMCIRCSACVLPCTVLCLCEALCVFVIVSVCLWVCVHSCCFLAVVLEHPHAFAPPCSSDQYAYSENLMHYVEHIAAVSEKRTMAYIYNWLLYGHSCTLLLHNELPSALVGL